MKNLLHILTFVILMIIVLSVDLGIAFFLLMVLGQINAFFLGSLILVAATIYYFDLWGRLKVSISRF